MPKLGFSNARKRLSMRRKNSSKLSDDLNLQTEDGAESSKLQNDNDFQASSLGHAMVPFEPESRLQEVAPEESNMANVLQTIGENQQLSLREAIDHIAQATAHLNEAPEYVRKLVKTTRDLRGGLPHNEAVSEDMRMTYQQAHDEIQDTETQVTEFVKGLTEQKWACIGMNSAFMTLCQKIKAVHIKDKSAKFDPALFEPDIKQLEAKAQEMGTLHKATNRRVQPSSVSALKKIERVIPRAALEGTRITEEALATCEKHQVHIDKLIKEEKSKEYAIKAMLIRKDEINGDIEHIESEHQRLEGVKSGLAANSRELIEADRLSLVDKKRAIEDIRKKRQDDQMKLADRRQQSVREANEDFNDSSKEFGKIQRDLEKSMLETSTHVGNDIIFVLDKSGSMSGSRWISLLTAVDGFKATRSADGMDTMSIVVFDYVAKVELQNEPICGCSYRIRATPDGGTRYAPAFEKAKECAEYTRDGARTILVFLTDGMSSDIDEAASIAKEMYEMLAYRGGLITFVVTLHADFDRSRLESIVKAGNGGKTAYNFNGEKVPLQADTSTANLPAHFRQLATSFSAQEIQTRRNLDFVKVQREESQQQHAKTLNAVEETYQKLQEHASSQFAVLETCAAEDAEKAHQLIESQRQQNVKLIGEVEDRLSQLQDDKAKRQTEAINLEGKVAMLQEHLKFTREEKDRNKEALRNMMALECCAELESIVKQKGKLLEEVGTTNETTLAQLMSQTDAYLTLRRNDQVIVADIQGAVGNLVSFADGIADAIRHPLHTETLPAHSYSDVLFEYYKVTQNLQITTPLRSAENFKIVLEHIGRQLPEEPSDFHIKCIITEFTAAELCQCVMADPGKKDPYQECKIRLSKRLANASAQLRAISKKVDSAENARKRASKQLDKILEEIEMAEAASGSEGASDSDVSEVEDDPLVKLKEKQSDLEEKLLDCKQDKVDAEKDLDEALEEHLSAFTLLKFALDEFRTVLQTEFSNLQVKFLIMHLFGIMQQVVQPMHSLVQMAEQCQQALYDDRSSTHSHEARDTKVSKARIALANWTEPVAHDLSLQM